MLKSTTNAEELKSFRDGEVKMKKKKMYFYFGNSKIYPYHKISENDLIFEEWDDNSFKIKFEIPRELENLG